MYRRGSEGFSLAGRGVFYIMPFLARGGSPCMMSYGLKRRTVGAHRLKRGFVHCAGPEVRSGCPFELPQSLGAEMCMWALVARPALGHPPSGEAALVYIYIYI